MKTRKLVYGVGNNDAGYAVAKTEVVGYVDGKKKQKKVWECPYYRAWVSMLNRCYSKKLHERRPSYRGCNVSDNWLTFSVFKNWMMQQNWKGNQLDKDLLFEGNKIYSPEACVFVTGTTNRFTNDHGAKRGKWLIGTHWNKEKGKFQASCGNPFSGKNENLGYFTSEQQAHEAWRKRKLELAHELAAVQTDPRVAKALIERYSKPQEQN